MDQPNGTTTPTPTPEAPAPLFDLPALLSGLLSRGGGADARVLEVLAGVIQQQSDAAREDRAERNDLRRRIEKLQELLERARLDARAGDFELDRSLSILRAGFAAEIIRALGLDPEGARQQDVFARIRELRLKAGELEPPKVPPASEPIALDTPPDSPTRPAQELPKV